jgi:hypothetical protein
LRDLKIFGRDCIQSLRFDVMLAERKKWKLANKPPKAMPGYVPDKY